MIKNYKLILKEGKHEAGKPNGKKVFGIILKDLIDKEHRFLICIKPIHLSSEIKKILKVHSGTLIEIIELILIQGPLKYNSDDPPDEYWIRKQFVKPLNEYDLEDLEWYSQVDCNCFGGE